MILYWFFLIP